MSNVVAPLKLILYGVDNEIKREVTRSIVPWGILEKAIDLQEEFDGLQVDGDGTPVGITKDQIQKLTNFVIFVFDDAVTAEELKRGASLVDMISIYQQIFRMVSQIMPKNPTPAPAESLKKVRQGRKRQ